MKTIFLAGIHGVGKSYFGKELELITNIKHLTASQLIKEEKGKSTWDTDKYAAELDDNQIALIRSLQNTRNNINRHIILDGHFVLINDNGKLTALEVDVFRNLNLSCIILLTQDIDTIEERLKKRDRSFQDREFVINLANAELQNAIKISNKLNLPLNRACKEICV